MSRHPARRLAALVGAAAILLATTVAPPVSAATLPPVDAAGSDTSLPDTDSAVTVAGTGAFAGVRFHVNQTRQLVNQAVSVSWSGATPTDSVVNVANDFMQMMQCWGDPVTAADGSQGPDPTHCEFGGQSQKSWQGNVPGVRVASQYRHYQDYTKADQPQVDVPFTAVEGTVVPKMFNGDFSAAAGGTWWLNPYFSYFTTNEIPYAPTYLDGTGSQLFTADTGLEAPGLGCGQMSQPVSGGGSKVPECWLVIVPRTTFTQEHGNPPPDDDGPGVQGAPFQPSVWAHRVAIPLDFKPLATSCQLGATERRIVGSELLAPAMSNWNPALCAAKGTSPFNYASLSDSQAAAQLLGSAAGGAGMSMVSRPIDASSLAAGTSLVYAPVALTGLVIGFNIERVMDANKAANGEIPDAELDLTARRVQHLNLTPRLVAKLLTESYRSSFLGLPAGKDYDWARSNPQTLAADPDFVAVNPEFTLLTAATGPALSGLVVELNSSDAAYELWQWIDSDAQARAFLAGNPDEYGMKVNPHYSTDAKVNPSGRGLTLPLDDFPKNDPYSVKIDQYPSSFQALTMLDLMPYQNSLKSAALAVRTTDMGDKTAYDPTIGGIGYQANGPQYQGSRFILAVTDAASAAQYGLQTASLRNAAGNFVAPTQASLLAAQQSMKASAVPGVALSDPASKNAQAYPLTDVVYAATIPQKLDAGSRKDFAALIRFLARSGQAPGVGFGQLPPGYASLPADLGAQALAASAVIAAGGPPATTTPPPTTSSTTATTTTTASTSRTTTSTRVTSSPVPTTSTPAGAASGGGNSLPRPTSGQAAGNQPGAGGNGGGPARTSATPTSRPVPSHPSAPRSTSPKAASRATAGTTTAPPTSDAHVADVAVATPRDVRVPPIVPIGFGVALLAAIAAPFVNRRRFR